MKIKIKFINSYEWIFSVAVTVKAVAAVNVVVVKF